MEGITGKINKAVPFSVMAKPIGSRCNLACSYCYYLEKDKFGEAPSLFRMTDELLEKYIKQYIAAAPGPSVSFVWHGGEPTLAGMDFYKKAVELQKKYLPEGETCWNNIQTNGILLDDEWCEFLAENKFDVGLSIDGASKIHDKYRKDRGGNGTYDRVFASVKRLKAHGIEPDLLCTVTSDTAKKPLETYRALKSLKTGWMQFIPIVRRNEDGTVTEDSVTPEGYGDFLCQIFDEWIYNDLGVTDVQLFAETALVMSGGKTNLCWMAPTCGRVLILEKDGNVYSCDHFVSSEYRIGNINTDELGTLVDLPRQTEFGNFKRDGLPKKCRECRFLRLCNGACPKDRTVFDEGEKFGRYYLCEGLEKFFFHAEKPMSEVMELSRRGMSPAVIMTRLRAERDSGRNSKKTKHGRK